MFRKIIKTALFLLLFVNTTITFAVVPSIRFEHINIGDGLTINRGQTILQDSAGFLWFGTSSGLVRYDGYHKKVFNNDPTDINSLSGNVITAIIEDSKGNLWVGTSDGLNLFNPKTQQFSHYRHQESDTNSLSNDDVRSIAEDSQGNIWVGTRDGALNQLKPNSQQFLHYRQQVNGDDNFGHHFILGILEDAQGTIWLATTGGLNKFNPKTGQFIRYLHKADDPSTFNHDFITSIVEGSQGDIWFGTLSGGLRQFNPKTGQFNRYRHQGNDPSSLSNDEVSSIAEDSQGNIWVGTIDGLNKLNPKTGKFSHYRHKANVLNSLSHDYVTSITEDSQGNLWVSSFEGPLNMFNPKTERFGHYRHQNDDPGSLSDGSVWKIIEDSKGNLWVGTDTGLNKFDPKTKQFSHYRHHTDDANSLNNDNVSSIAEDSQGNIWVGTDDGLNQFNPITKQFKHYLDQANFFGDLIQVSVDIIFEDSQRNIWIGRGGIGLSKFDPKTEQFIYYRHQTSDTTSLSNDSVMSIAEDSQGNIWVGTRWGGLNKFNPKTGQFSHYRHQANDPNSLSDDFVMDVFVDGLNKIWVGTQGGGLNFLDQESGKFKRYNDKQGLLSNTVYSIEEDGKGHLWLGTNLGLSRFNPILETFKNYNISDGLQSNDFNQGASFKNKKGELFFGGTNGFNRFFPEKIIDNNQLPKVAITDMLLLNKSVPIIPIDNLKAKNNLSTTHKTGFHLSQAINTTKAIILNHENNVFAFEFTALDFTNPQKNQFAYQLVGWDKNWVTTDYKHRRATYTNLPSGDYTFNVKASNSDGYWNEEGASLQITILPPPWKTWQAYTIYTFIFAIILFVFLRLQRKTVIFERNLNAQLEDKVKESTKELREAYSQLEEISLTDQLTGLKNRRFLQDNIINDIALVERKYLSKKIGESVSEQQELDLICFLVDLDNFKLVNDVHGHAVGDAVLIQIKSILEKVFRETDYLIRWGGEEFLVVARFTDRNNAPELAERLRIAVEGHDFDIDENNCIRKTCSIGFACYPFTSQNTKALEWFQVMDIADHCLYAAKKSSRNAWVGLKTSESCTDVDLFTRTIKQTKTLIDSEELQLLSSISDHDKILWQKK